jgi:integrase
MIAYNPADRCTPPKLNRKARERKMKEETWTPDQLRTFLGATESDRLAACWRLVAATGLRRGELLGIPWSALDLEDGSVEVAQQIVMVRNVPTVKATPKTNDSWESIALDAETVLALREHRRRQLEERLAAGELWQDSGLAFTDELGRPLNPQTVLRRFQRLSTAAGLPSCRLHSIRHAHATALLEAGVPIEVVSKRLRHADISTTLGLYAHTTKKLDRQVAEIGARLLAR